MKEIGIAKVGCRFPSLLSCHGAGDGILRDLTITEELTLTFSTHW